MTNSPAQSVASPVQAKTSKLPLIILGGCLILLLCICCLALIVVVVPKYSKSDNQDYIEILKQYNKNVDIIKTKWDAEETNCDKSREYDAYADATYQFHQVEPLYAQVSEIVNGEWNCYKKLREFEVELDQSISDRLYLIDCSKTDYEDDCLDFKSTINKLLVSEKNGINLLETDYENWLELNICYIDSLKLNFEDDAAKKRADDECERNRVDLTDQLDAYEDEYADYTNKLKSIAAKIVTE